MPLIRDKESIKEKTRKIIEGTLLSDKAHQDKFNMVSYKRKIVQKTVGFYEQDLHDLRVIFANKGLGLSSGIRMIIKEFINKNQLQ